MDLDGNVCFTNDNPNKFAAVGKASERSGSRSNITGAKLIWSAVPQV
jgi:hypothetical protein